MPLNAPVWPLTPGSSGYSPQQRLPTDGSTPPPDSTDPNQINQWLTAQPWYQTALRQWGLDPNRPTLSVQQRAQMIDAAHRAGANVGDDLSIATNGTFESVSTPPVVKAALIAMGAWAGGAAIAGAASGGAPAAGVSGLGPTTAGSMAGTDAAVAGGTVPASLAAGGGGAAAAGGAGGFTSAFTGPDAATSALGPTTPASMAGTSAAAGGSTVPAALGGPGAMPVVGAATGGAGSAGTALARVLPSAVGNIVGGVLQNHAIDSAMQAQIDANNRALAAQQAAGERAIGILSPWANVGGAAVNRLGQLMHLNVVPPSSPTPAAATPGAPAGSVQSSNGYSITGLANPQMYRPGPSQPVAPGPAGAGSFGGSMGTATMRAPTGETQAVPLDQVAHFTQLGAQRVS